MNISSTNTGLVTFTFADVLKGTWAWPSPFNLPDGYVSLMQNLDLPGGVPTSMNGDNPFIALPIDALTGTITLAATLTVLGSDPIPIIATSSGNVYHYKSGAWSLLRTGLSTTAGLWWSDEQYGPELFISNPYDGVYRYDGTYLVPIGAKTIARAESSEAADWTNETADTTNYKEGTQSVKVTSGNPGASSILTYTKTLDTATGRYDATDYELTKLIGDDAYHFWVRFSNGAGATITAATTTLVITDSGAKTLTWPATLWRSAKSATAAAIALNTNDWKEVWVFPSQATEVATFNPKLVTKLEWKVTTSAGQTDMNIDDIYSVYLQTMPASLIVKEWKNMLFGFNEDEYSFSKVGAPDQYDVDAYQALKSGGEPIQGVARFFNQLTIGTTSHIITLSGSTQGSTYPAYLFDLNEVTDEVGISSHRSIVKADNTLFWYWNGRIIRYNGTQAEQVSYPIDPILNTLDDSAAQFIVGAPFRKKHEIWWTIRPEGESVNTECIKFAYKWQAFIRLPNIVTPVLFKTTVSGTEKLLTIDETSRIVYEQDYEGAYSSVGTDLEYILELPAMAIPGFSLQWVNNYLQFLNNTGDVLVQYRHGDTLRALDQASYQLAETVTMTEDGEYGKLRLGERAAWLQVRFLSTGVKMELQPPFIITARQQPAEFIRNTP